MIHLVGLPHTETVKTAFSWCAYTQKTRKLADMLTSLGHEVTLYAGEANDAKVAELVPVVKRSEQAKWFKKFDWTRDVFNEFNPALAWWQVMNNRAIKEIRVRSKPGDILALTMGLSQKPIADAFFDDRLLIVESGVGYSGVFAPYRVYESHAWAHYVAALQHSDDVRFYDAVIPNSFETEDFPIGEGTGGYYLFMGRVMQRKGPYIAAEACKRLGVKLLVAGQGVAEAKPGRIVADDGTILTGDIEYVGVVGPGERAKLMGGAIATFAPTQYLEPFGGVAVESMLCGTPAITTDWGAFTETVKPGGGFRCRTLAEFVEAAIRAPDLDRCAVKDQAARYSTTVVRWDYDRYLKQLSTLSGAGWYTVEERTVSEERPQSIGLAKSDTKERDDAQEAKKKADPKVDDPSYMPNIDPQLGEHAEEAEDK